MDGATCAVPASPELVILPAALVEIRESELGNESISYSLALSAAPSTYVRIRIEKQAFPVTKCLSYADGLELTTNALEFNTSNYKFAQIVTVLVTREPGLFQGNRIASILHFVESEVRGCKEVTRACLIPIHLNNSMILQDPDWSSLSLRSTSITLVRTERCYRAHRRILL